ncbi:AsnC family transcriptional regulator [Halorubrum lacusprofundi]|jgi:DNA-binding Lrp family transcriptional regulator|uniref:Transcriptional regulator, AsnC family n=1 Tax=Halorubrum lacusprofundi (strain ATCC 49239 / DSM 5036 / JCM 8891 / ACAM 34) TaxID=416348 RepID=B9LRC7_HALLT|nr:AsnC family transcriptional regulator [Halorubrum lacusprofundi]ACM55750.1 putative transcriptional regulator, AsnC family [Halorubrum lacusprofundi ATCC 49239]MCG1007219.1 AsnC family transcriptional regulator [Halorubrum lacusprofundi]
MRDLDETDLEILSLLAEDARRPFSEIGDRVGLSGPAVSDRVTRLEETGVIKRFTVDVDRTKLRAGVPVLVDVELPVGAESTDGSNTLDAARERVRDADAVEHQFVTAEGDLRVYARVEGRNVREWVVGLFEGVGVEDYTVTLVDEFEWTPSIEGVEFALTCAECSNTVDSEGETARIDGEVYHFCCPSCLSQFRERYQRLEEGA